MIVRSLLLQHFRNYTQKKIEFSDTLTIIVGENTSGKTNLSESLYLLSTGKSFKTSADMDMIAFNQDVGRVQALLVDVHEEKLKVEVVVASTKATGGRFSKK